MNILPNITEMHWVKLMLATCVHMCFEQNVHEKYRLAISFIFERAVINKIQTHLNVWRVTEVAGNANACRRLFRERAVWGV